MSDMLPSTTSNGSVLAAPSPGAVRDELAELVVRDLLGPVGGDEEEVADSPTDWYVLGRLARRQRTAGCGRGGAGRGCAERAESDPVLDRIHRAGEWRLRPP
jgi:hypothetical protein